MFGVDTAVSTASWAAMLGPHHGGGGRGKVNVPGLAIVPASWIAPPLALMGPATLSSCTGAPILCPTVARGKATVGLGKFWGERA